MPNIKLARLPDKTPVKVVVILTPDQHQMLTRYAEVYAAEHGEAASITDRVPAMLDAFMQGDRSFLKVLREESPR